MKAKEQFWYHWILNYSLGELMGIGAAAVVGRLLFVEFYNTIPTSPIVTPVLLIIAGAVEGFIIGYIQWKSLSKLVIDFKPSPWILTTIISTVVGWLLVLPPAILFISFLTKFSLLDNYYSILYIIAVGLAYGGIVGIPQYFIIKKFYRNAIVWIFANTLGWMLSFLIVSASFSIFNYFSVFIYNSVLMVAACVLSGFVQGIVTGMSLHFSMFLRKEHSRKHTLKKEMVI
jgi:hypothetical protein